MRVVQRPRLPGRIRRGRARNWSWVGAVAVVLWLLAACGGPATSTGAGVAGATSATAAPTTSGVAPASTTGPATTPTNRRW